MRKLVFIILVVLALQHRDKIAGVFDLSPQVAPYNGEQVIMYGTRWCGYCAKARALFAEQGISFYEYDIDRSPEGRKQYNELRGRGVPLLLINGSRIDGYGEQAILTALRSKGA